MQPRCERRIAAELIQPVERPNERLLREVRREIGVSGHSVHQPVDPLDMRVIQRTLGLGLAGETAVHELTVDQTRIFGHEVELGDFRRGSEPNHRHEPTSDGWVGSRT